MKDYLNNPDLLLTTLYEIFKHEEQIPETEILEHSNIQIELTGYDNWNGGTDIYSIYLQIPTKIYAKYDDLMNEIEKSIRQKLEPILRTYSNVWIGDIVITPIIEKDNKWGIKRLSMIDDELIKDLEAQRNIMISVSTGGARIQNVNSEYIERYRRIDDALNEREIENPNPYNDLWAWYGKWSSGDLPTYQSRRIYISGLFNPIIELIRKGPRSEGKKIFSEPTGWAKIDRSIGEMRKRLEQAQTEEQFQVVGLLSRETLITLAQIIYIPEKHGTLDGVEPSKTDAKRMLEAYLNTELSDRTNEVARKHAKAANDLANDLTHRRTANFQQAALCAEATTSVVNLIAIISGQRNP